VCCGEFVWRPTVCVCFGVPTWRPELGGVQNGGSSASRMSYLLRCGAGCTVVCTRVHTVCTHVHTVCVCVRVCVFVVRMCVVCEFFLCGEKKSCDAVFLASVCFCVCV